MAFDPIQDAELLTRFTYHVPVGDQPERYEHIREAALDFARDIVAMTPLSREQGNALSALDEVVFWANAAIARRTRVMVDVTGPDDLEPPFVPGASS